jgi:hypothetical protein
MRNSWLNQIHRRMTVANRRARRSDSLRVRPTVGRLEDRVTPAIATFQEGIGGYAGTQDAELEFDAPTTTDATGGEISIDNVDGDPVGPRQGLLRFDNIFGTGAGQIPLGSTINSATLRVVATDAGGEGGQLGPYRMLQNWSEATVTWSTFGATVGGVQGDDVKADQQIEDVLTNFANGAATSWNVRRSVQAWAYGAPNFGWGITQKGGGGWDFASSENGTVANRPLLTIDYTPPAAGAAGNFNFTQPTYTVKEGNLTATITVVRNGGTTGAVGVSYATAPGSAGTGDFTQVSGTLNFAAGEFAKTFTVSILDDTAFEGSETINLSLSTPTGGAALGTVTTGTLTIADQDVLINEIIADLPGSDTSSEYFELVGTPGTALTNVYFVAFRGDEGSQGQAQMVVPLGTASLGSNGLLVIKAATGGYTIPAGTTVVTDSQLNAANGAIADDEAWTFQLIRSATAIVEGTDYDVDNNNTLELLPAGADVVDSISWTDASSTDLDRFYAPRVFQSNPGSGAPGAVARFLGDDRPSALGAWFNSSLDPNSRAIYQLPPNGSVNVPDGAKVSPGVVNALGFYRFSTQLATFDGAEGGTATVTVIRQGPTTVAETVQYATANGTATAGQDYTATSGTLNFPIGATSASFQVTLLNDPDVEGPETLTINLSNPSGTTLPATVPATVTINDGDDADASFQEEVGNYFGTQDTYVWAASPGVSQDSPFQYGVDLEEGNPATPLWALLRFDNIIGTGAGQIPPGSRIIDARVNFFINDITDFGVPVTFHRMFSDWDESSTWNSLVNGLLRDDTEARITPDGQLVAPSLTGGPIPVTGAGMAAAVQSWVNGAANNGWAIFSSSGNGIDFGSSENPTTANRPQLQVSYIPPSGAGTLQFEEATYSVTEGTTTVNVPVVRVGGSTGSATVGYNVTGGTASAGADFTGATTGTLTFGAGVVRQNITFTITNDTALEANETVNLGISTPGGGATLGTLTSATLNLRDNEVDTALRLNEILVNPSGTDNPFEYFELIGTPGAPLGNIYVVAVDGDGAPGIGRPDYVLDLSSAVQGTSGLTVVKASTGGHAIPAGTTVVTDARFNGADLIPNNSTSFLLIHSPNASIAQGGGFDYDPEGDGIPNLPPGAVVIDSIGWTDGGAEDMVVNGVNLAPPVADNAPDAATRIRGNTTANNVSSWYYGQMTGANTAFTYNAAGGVGLPSGAIVTPGSQNFRTGAAALPGVQAITIDNGTSQRSMVRNLTVTFDGPVTFEGATVDAFSLVRTGTGGGAVTLAATPTTVSGVTVVTLTFSGPMTANGSLIDGNYTLTVRANQVRNTNGLMAADRTENFHRYYGDVNGDRAVNGLDLAVFRVAFGTTTGNPNFADFLDFNGDGAINGLDLAEYRTHFGTVLAP